MSQSVEKFSVSQLAAATRSERVMVTLPGIHALPPQLPGERYMHRVIARTLGIANVTR